MTTKMVIADAEVPAVEITMMTIMTTGGVEEAEVMVLQVVVHEEDSVP